MDAEEHIKYWLEKGFLEGVDFVLSVEVCEPPPAGNRLPDISFSLGSSKCFILFEGDEFERLKIGKMTNEELFDKGQLAATIMLDRIGKR